MYNPNDNTADIYDIVSKPLRPAELTRAELELITSLISPNETILDIGAGTGRHAVPLAEQGYKVTVTDSASQMLKELKAKNSDVKIIEADILTYDLARSEFSLIMFMWNAWNEIALADDDAKSLLEKLKLSLKPGGKILINIDNPINFDPQHLTFGLSERAGGYDYELSSHVIKYKPATRTTTSLEDVAVYDNEHTLVREEKSEIVQRWWTLDEIAKLASAADLKLTEHKITLNEELYLEFTPV